MDYTSSSTTTLPLIRLLEIAPVGLLKHRARHAYLSLRSAQPRNLITKSITASPVLGAHWRSPKLIENTLRIEVHNRTKDAQERKTYQTSNLSNSIDNHTTIFSKSHNKRETKCVPPTRGCDPSKG
eukprot:2834883-Amphidinium_carterae.1